MLYRLLFPTMFLYIICLGANTSFAETINIINCIEGKRTFYSFDGTDKSCSSEADEISIGYKESEALECSGDRNGKCKIAMDYVGGQWAHYNCTHLEVRKLKEDSTIVICSEKSVANGFTAMDKSVVFEPGIEVTTCAEVCK